LPGHRVQGETRTDFRDTARALGHHHEVDDDQNDEHDDAHRVVAADHHFAKGFDHVSRCRPALVAFQQHHARGRYVERQPQQGGDEQNGGEYGEIQRAHGIHGHAQHHQRDGDVEGEEDIQQHGRQRQGHHGQHDQQQYRNTEVALRHPVDATEECVAFHACAGGHLLLPALSLCWY
jgi:hypothetical protein